MKKIGMILVTLAFMITGCQTTANFSSSSEPVKVRILRTKVNGELPQTGAVPWTTFKRFPLKVEKEGCEPLYAQLPLRVSGGAIFCDIMFFAPAMFLNMQHAFKFYEFDVENKVIKFKRKQNQEWTIYHVPEDQQTRIKDFFEQSPEAK